MPKSSRQAGRNIRKLALNRRVKAIASFGSAIIFLLIPFLFIKNIERLGSIVIPLKNLSQTSKTSPILALIYVPFVIIALGTVANGIFLWKRANQADQGAKGEEDIAQELLKLKNEGWAFEYGTRFGNTLADIDVFVTSPRNQSYVTDVKSHRGEITTDGENLYRRMGNQTYSFEHNFLPKVMKQALQVKQKKGLNFVTPVLVFSDAKVSVPNGKIKGVYVVERSRLVSLLQTLG